MLNISHLNLLIHGPYNIRGLTDIREELKLCPTNSFEKIIFVVYNDRFKEEYLASIDLLYGTVYPTEIVFVNDILNPGFYNINRQVISVSSGLKAVKNPDDIVIKLRIDQYIAFKKVFSYIKKYEKQLDTKILTTSTYSMKHRLYHPSDMFLISCRKNLDAYYSLEYQRKTHLDVYLNYHHYYKKILGKYAPIDFSPEALLFKNFLVKNHWDIKNNHRDSKRALKKYIIILDSWDIDLRTRAPKYKTRKNIILPFKHILLKSDMDYIFQTCFYSKEKNLYKIVRNIKYKSLIMKDTMIYMMKSPKRILKSIVKLMKKLKRSIQA